MVGMPGAAQAKDAAVLCRGQLDLLHVIAPVRCRLIVLGAGFDPFHRAPEFHRAKHRNEIALNLRNLAAEAAADLWRDHPQAIFGHAGDDRHDETDDVRVLGRVPERQLAGGRCELRHGAPRLDRRRDQPLLDDAVAHHD
jgi:hypothetical protein